MVLPMLANPRRRRRNPPTLAGIEFPIGTIVGVTVGLAAPPLLAATAIGAAAGAVVGRAASSKVKSGIERQAAETIPWGGAGVIVAYPRSSAGEVDQVVTHALKKVVGEAEGKKVKALKAALADAQEKMAAPS